ncbi:MAG: aquaporin [Planctomycetota bacterium]
MKMEKYLTETIGTFFLVLTIGLTVVGGSPYAPIAIGSVLMVMVYMGGHISGGHFNPAVSLAVWFRGKLSGADFVWYMIAQVFGAFLAAAAVLYITGKTFAGPAPAVGVSTTKALLVEFLFTFALALVVLNTATAKRTANNSYFGLAIGFTVLAGAFAGGPISGGAFNPAVGFGPLLIHTMAGGGSMQHLWLYLVGPFLGGAVAATVFNIQNSGESAS